MSNDKTTDLKNEVKKLTMIQSAKDMAARENNISSFSKAKYLYFIDEIGDSLLDEITDRAMEIYAEGERTEGIREGFEAARLTLIQEGRNCGDLYPTVDDYLNSKK